MMSLPLGIEESTELAFVDGRAADELREIEHAVVAMLNGVPERGEIWVGFAVAEHRAVKIESIEHPGTVGRRIRDCLHDRVDPIPTREIEIHVVTIQDGRSVLRIEVSPQRDQWPYALVHSDGACLYLTRQGWMNRPLTSRELEGSEPEGELERAIAASTDERWRHVGRTAGDETWITLRPSRPLSLDLDDPRYEELLQDPEASGWPRTSFGFTLPVPAERGEGGLRVDAEATGQTTSISPSGEITHVGPLARLAFRQDGVIRPHRLLELNASLFRLAREVLSAGLTKQDWLVADCALIGVEGYGVRETPWGSPGLVRDSVRPLRGRDPIVLPRPLAFGAEELAEAPDRCGFRLTRQLLEASGAEDGLLDMAYDDRAGRLLLAG